MRASPHVLTFGFRSGLLWDPLIRHSYFIPASQSGASVCACVCVHVCVHASVCVRAYVRVCVQ